jgi:hypothetical protein
MRSNANDVKIWIEELKKRGIYEFQFKDLPYDLKNIATVRKAKFLGKIKEKKKIKTTIVWKVK